MGWGCKRAQLPNCLSPLLTGVVAETKAGRASGAWAPHNPASLPVPLLQLLLLPSILRLALSPPPLPPQTLLLRPPTWLPQHWLLSALLLLLLLHP